MPVHPEGDPDTDQSVQVCGVTMPGSLGRAGPGTALSAVCSCSYQYASICRGAGSIIQRLAARFPGLNIDNYIGFYNLRNHGIVKDTPCTEQVAGRARSSSTMLLVEVLVLTFPLVDVSGVACVQVYVHSKVTIVDDRLAFIGSANINDRSLLADTDSELCVAVTGGEEVTVPMNGVPVPHRSKFVHTLRLRLWREHLGLMDPMVAAGACNSARARVCVVVYVRSCVAGALVVSVASPCNGDTFCACCCRPSLRCRRS